MAQINLTWAASLLATSYRVYRTTVVGLKGALVATVPTTAWSDTSAVPGTQYWYGVVGVNAAGESALSVQATATIPIVQPPPPPPPPTMGDDFVQITDSPADLPAGDGPTWVYANAALGVRWKKPGGDWRDKDDVPHGMNPYARITADAVKDFSVDVTGLVARLLTRNTGIYILQESGLSNFASRNDGNPANDPRLHIVTSAGVFDVPCIVDTWIAPSSAYPMGGDTIVKNPILLRFGLNDVSGTLQSATLTLACVTVYAIGPGKLAIHYLDCPPLTPVGVVEQGIASSVTKDTNLTSHPDVLIYDDLVSLDYIGSHFQGIAGYSAATPAGTRAETIDWPQYGLKAARVWNDANAERIISWHHWMEPKQSPAQPWQRDFGDGYEELYFRYLIEIGEDVWRTMTAAGAKLPGFGGTYNWSTSGAVTQPPPDDDGTWEARLWHSGISKAHPNWYGGMVYLYAAEHTVREFYNQGNSDPRNQFTGCIPGARVVSIEQRVKLNTLAVDGTPNSDGIIEVWIDGVKALSRTDVKLRGYDNARIQDAWSNIYHGGVGQFPTAPCHYDYGGLCIARSYIGPPKLVSGGPSDPPPPPQTIDLFIASKSTIVTGESLALSWATSNATAVRLDGVVVDANMVSFVVAPASSRDYVLEADGPAGTIRRTVSIVVAAVPVPDPTLPPWVPVPGTFAEFTTNVPTDLAPANDPWIKAAILANWTGGTFVDDFGQAGGAAYHGGGEHFSWDDRGGVLMLDVAAQKYVMRCVSNPKHMGVVYGPTGPAGSLTDRFGAYQDNLYPQSKHTYLSLVQFPKVWGGGTQGGLVRVCHAGGLTNPTVGAAPGYGLAGTWAFDLAQEVNGVSRLTGEQTYDLGSGQPAYTNDAPGAGIDRLREGWWVFARTGSGTGDRMVFTHKSGRVDPPGTSAISLNWGRLHHFADDDTLIAIANSGWMCHPGPTNPWKQIPFNVAPDDAARWAVALQYLGYIGFQWCESLRCLIGIDTSPVLKGDGSPDLNAVRVWKIIPPDTAAKRWTDQWYVERELLRSADGSVIDMSTDHAVNAGNGTSYGKLVECYKYRFLVWTRRIDRRGQALRLKDM